MLQLQICHAKKLVGCESSTDLDSDFSYNSLTKSLLDNSTKIEDYFGSVAILENRGDQNHRIGYYSPIYEYRMTDSQTQMMVLEITLST